MRRTFAVLMVVALIGMWLLPVATATAEEPATIRIVYDALPHHPHNVTFRGELGSFRLDDDHNGALPRLRVFTIDPGASPVYVRQVPEENKWPLVNLSCSDGQSVVDMTHHSARIHITAGERLSCVWINHKV